MRTVFVAGATGYLGRHICTEYRRRDWHVRALVRDAARARDLDADQLVVAEATQPESLEFVMEGADLAISALGITRQADGLSYRDVDYQANLSLLTEALRASVPRFAYVHVLNADRLANVELVAAKAAFVRDLRAAEIASTIICPSGYFSDMEDFLSVARSGRVWLFGDGAWHINPIHGADLAEAIREAVDAGRDRLDIGGPDIFTQIELARLAFESIGKPASITCLPDWLRKVSLRVLPYLTPRRIHGPAQFFLAAMGGDMVAAPYGNRRLADHFRALASLERKRP